MQVHFLHTNMKSFSLVKIDRRPLRFESIIIRQFAKRKNRVKCSRTTLHVKITQRKPIPFLDFDVVREKWSRTFFFIYLQHWQILARNINYRVLSLEYKICFLFFSCLIKANWVCEKFSLLFNFFEWMKFTSIPMQNKKVSKKNVLELFLQKLS